MNIFRSKIGTLNEILFENKNRSYGAYAIRAAYGSTVFKSLGITSSMILGTAWLLSVWMAKEIVVILPPVADPPPVVEYTVNVELDKPKPKTQDDSPGQPPQRSGGASTSYEIRDHAADSNSVVNDSLSDPGPNVTTGTSNDPAPGTPAVNGTGNTSGDAQASDAPFVIYDEAPVFPGGLQQFWAKNLRYPTEAREAGVEGKVAINFVLDENGKIISCKVIKKLGFGCDEEVLRVVKLMPDWKPGKINGKAIKISFNQAVEFKLK